MSPERWQQVENLLQSILDRAPDERAALLDAACAADAELRREVEALLAYEEQAKSFIEAPALEVAAKSLADDCQTKLEVGGLIGPYKILMLLGRGGMAEVYLARDTRLGRRIALKLLPASFTRDEERVRRFRQEARAASSLNHPNILTIHEIGQLEEMHFIATEFIEGETLRRRIQRRKLEPSDAIDISIQVCNALAAAHEEGIIHRDIKPENIMLRPDGYVKVLDFGLAKLTERQAEADEEEATLPKVDTNPGVVMGTVQYMSPEQARGQAVDERTDIFSLGAALYEMVTGRLPFEGETSSHVIVSILEREPLPIADCCPEAPAELERIVAKALRKDREKRYRTIKDLVADLKSLQQRLQNKVETGSSTRAESCGETAVSAIGGQAVVDSAKERTSRTGEETAARTTSNAEHLINEDGRHKLAFAVLAAAIFVLVGAGIWL